MTDNPLLHYESLFALAKDLGYRLNQFVQLDDGTFRANWRTIGETPEFSNCATDVAPFHALKDSLGVAIKTLPPAAREAPAPPSRRRIM